MNYCDSLNGDGKVILTTPRLILREMTHSDYLSLYAVLADADIMRHYPYTFDEKRVKNWIERNIERYRIFGFGLFAVCLADGGEMIGDCGLTMQKIGDSIKPEIGYHIRGDMQKKGYATEAAIAVRDFAFENTPFCELYSYMQSDNLPSQKTALAYGCSFVESFADEGNGSTSVYKITRKEWEKLKAKNQSEKY